MRRLLFVPLLSLVFAGCLPDKPDYIDELDLVYTNYAPEFNFRAQSTYSIADSVVLLQGELEDGELPEMVKPLYGDRIIRGIKDNLNRNGWTEVAADQDPDVVMLCAVNTTTSNNYYYSWGYWGWYYPGYAGGWGWYYPGYYPPVVSSYSTGTLLVQMTYPDGRGENDYVPVQWIMVIDGLLEGSSSQLINRIGNNIDQGFTQSEYLNIQ